MGRKMVVALFTVLLTPSFAEPLRATAKAKELAPLHSNDLSDANCPKGWNIIVLNLGQGGFNCESQTCSCHDPARTKCTDTKKYLDQVRLPSSKWKCFDAPAGCIWCGQQSE
jgi:hypothetical protein